MSIKIFILLLTFYAIASRLNAEEFYYPKTSVFSVSGGILYDDISDIDRFLISNDFSPLSQDYMFFYGISYKSNYFPIIHSKPQILLYSIEINFPFVRNAGSSGRNFELQTHSIMLEISTFESYLKTFTVHPLIALAYSKTEFILSTNSNNFEIDNIFNKPAESYLFNKKEIILLIGGGCDLRLNLSDDNIDTKNILISFEAKYLISLNFDKINDAAWTVNGKYYTEVPEYYHSGISLDFKISVEDRKKQ